MVGKKYVPKILPGGKGFSIFPQAIMNKMIPSSITLYNSIAFQWYKMCSIIDVP